MHSIKVLFRVFCEIIVSRLNIIKTRAVSRLNALHLDVSYFFVCSSVVRFTLSVELLTIQLLLILDNIF